MGQNGTQGETAAQTKGAVTREGILIAAERLFAEKGYAGCTLRELADAVGMKAGSFYYHFRAKEEILDALVEESTLRLTQAVEQALSSLDADAPAALRLKTAMYAHVAMVLSASGPAAGVTAVWDRLPPTLKGRKREKRHTYDALWEELVDEAQRAGTLRQDIDATILRPYLLAVMNRAVEWFDPLHMTRDEASNAVVKLALEGALYHP